MINTGRLNNYCNFKMWRSGDGGGLDSAVLRFVSCVANATNVCSITLRATTEVQRLEIS
jgi:hypothetical protein